MKRCASCVREISKAKLSRIRRSRRLGRPWKREFCGSACYRNWIKKRHLENKARWLRFQRSVWGTTGAERRRPDQRGPWGRKAEIAAKDSILPALGFSGIVDTSDASNSFFVDFIATKGRKKVLVDSTVKLKAYVPSKARMAEALGMDLYILHVAPKDHYLFVLNKIQKGRVVSRVPAERIRAWARLGRFAL